MIDLLLILIGQFCRRQAFSGSVVDRHRFDADPDPNFHFDADPEIRIWILTLVLQMLENLNFFLTLVNSSISLHCFIFS
jgi:hypothetical protein